MTTHDMLIRAHPGEKPDTLPVSYKVAEQSIDSRGREQLLP